MNLKLIPDNVNIDFIGHKNKVFFVSLFIVIASCIGLLFKGLNYGIDFRGGYVLEATFKTVPDLTNLRDKLSASYQGEISLQQFGTDGKNIIIKLEKEPENPSEESELKQLPLPEDQDAQKHVIVMNKIKTILGPDVTYRKIETIGPTVGQELVHNAMKAIILSLLAIVVYIAVRFEWQFAICGLIALAQDCIGLVGAYSWFRFEFNATAIIAILTTASYSINDSIVIFDRIRENIKRYRKMPFGELINKSINETLSRTVLTSGTTLLAILSLCLFGGEIIAAFSIPILIGVAFGTFSSIALAAPLLLYFKVDREKLASYREKKTENLTVV